jgi:hypothetical protein
MADQKTHDSRWRYLLTHRSISGLLWSTTPMTQHSYNRWSPSAIAVISISTSSECNSLFWFIPGGLFRQVEPYFNRLIKVRDFIMYVTPSLHTLSASDSEYLRLLVMSSR